jgi:hypothetical protein
MSRIAIAAALLMAVTTGGAFAQTTNTTVPNTEKMPGMAATSSDSGNMGTGASSEALGTGNTETHGVMSPNVPATSGDGATGANPSNPGGVAKTQ